MQLSFPFRTSISNVQNIYVNILSAHKTKHKILYNFEKDVGVNSKPGMLFSESNGYAICVRRPTKFNYSKSC